MSISSGRYSQQDLGRWYERYEQRSLNLAPVPLRYSNDAPTMSLSKNIRDRFHQKLDLGTNDSRDRFEASAAALEDSSRNFMGNGLRNNSSLRMSAQNMLNRSVTVLPSANNIAAKKR